MKRAFFLVLIAFAGTLPLADGASAQSRKKEDEVTIAPVDYAPSFEERLLRECPFVDFAATLKYENSPPESWPDEPERFAASAPYLHPPEATFRPPPVHPIRCRHGPGHVGGIQYQDNLKRLRPVMDGAFTNAVRFASKRVFSNTIA